LPCPADKSTVVENTETGEMRYLHVHDDQEVGDAIVEGQFTDGDDDQD
jgi:hypothetical protein